MLQQETDQRNPFILTLEPDTKTAVFFNELRLCYFPPDRNFLKAHLTLFHYLPFTIEEILNDLQTSVAGMNAFAIRVTDVVSIGKGVAYKLETPELQGFHRELQHKWKPFLKPQDLQKLWPHITVQNKVAPQEAKETLHYLKESFQPFSFQATGVTIWEYLGGPWQFVQTLSFSL